jgi:hypothetical protein
MKKRHAYALAAGLALSAAFAAAATQDTPRQPAQEAAPPADPLSCSRDQFGRTACPDLAGRFLSARAALAAHKWSDANNFMEQITLFDKTTPLVQELALKTAMLAARFDMTQPHIEALLAADPANPLAALAQAALFAREGHGDRAQAALAAARQDGTPDSVLARALARTLPLALADKGEGTDRAAFAQALAAALVWDYGHEIYRARAESRNAAARALFEALPQLRVMADEMQLYANPDDPAPLADLSAMAEARGDYAQALYYLERNPYGGPETPYVLSETARILEKAGDTEAALGRWQAASDFLHKREQALDGEQRALMRLADGKVQALSRLLPPAAPRPAP